MRGNLKKLESETEYYLRTCTNLCVLDVLAKLGFCPVSFSHSELVFWFSFIVEAMGRAKFLPESYVLTQLLAFSWPFAQFHSR